MNYKLVIFVPESHTDIVREAMGNAGAGKIGNYNFCTFSTKGVGRFKPNDKANPHIGEAGKLEEVVEERIETVCPKELLPNVLEAIKKVHPYEEIAYDVYPLENF